MAQVTCSPVTAVEAHDRGVVLVLVALQRLQQARVQSDVHQHSQNHEHEHMPLKTLARSTSSFELTYHSCQKKRLQQLVDATLMVLLTTISYQMLNHCKAKRR